MKRLVTMTAAAAVLVMAGSAYAATATLNTSASVSALCKATVGASIDFDALDPFNDTGLKDAVTPGSVTVQCTQGTLYSFDYEVGPKMTGGVNGFLIPIYPVAIAGVVPGSIAGTTYEVKAQVNAADYVNAPADAYAGTYTLTINY